MLLYLILVHIIIESVTMRRLLVLLLLLLLLATIETNMKLGRKRKRTLKEELGELKRLYETTDGCSKQYRCGTALWFLSALSYECNIIIDRSFCAPGHGKCGRLLLIFLLSILTSNHNLFTD